MLCEIIGYILYTFVSDMSNYEYKRPLSIAELQALLEEDDDDLLNADSIDAVYIPPEVDEITDEEDINDELLVEEESVADVAGTFEIHTNIDHETQNDIHCREQEPSSSSAEIDEQATKRRKKNVKQSVTANWTKSQPLYTTIPVSGEESEIEAIKNALGGKSPLEFFFYILTPK